MTNPLPHLKKLAQPYFEIRDSGIHGLGAFAVRPIPKGTRVIYIESTRDIAVGEELTYDYQLETAGRITPAKRERFACHCGRPNCRGTMLLLKSRPRAKPANKRSAE